MKKKVMTKLGAYKQAKLDLEFAHKQLDLLVDDANQIGIINVSSTSIIGYASTVKQFLFAIGVVKSQINACAELGEDPTDLLEKLDQIKTLFQLGKEISQWKEYINELGSYVKQLDELLNNDERFALMEYPSKK